MRVYIVVGVFEGVVESVQGFIDPGQAETELASLRRKLGIVEGYEEESENDAQLHEIDVDARPVSVMVRRQIW